jgi:hypothetical protein
MTELFDCEIVVHRNGPKIARTGTGEAKHAVATERSGGARVSRWLDDSVRSAAGRGARSACYRAHRRQGLHDARRDRRNEGTMPRPAKGVRLWLRPEERNPNGTLHKRAVWVIRDGPRKISTGCAAKDRAGAFVTGLVQFGLLCSSVRATGQPVHCLVLPKPPRRRRRNVRPPQAVRAIVLPRARRAD